MLEYYSVGDTIITKSTTTGLDISGMEDSYTITRRSYGTITYLPLLDSEVLVAEFDVKWSNGVKTVAEALICKSECDVIMRELKLPEDRRIYELDNVDILKDVIAASFSDNRTFHIAAGNGGTVIFKHSEEAYEVEFGIPDESGDYDYAFAVILLEDLELTISAATTSI